MPEMIEVEAYRDLAERAALGRQISAIETPDEWYLKRGLVPATLQELIGYQLSAARRRGKLLLLETQGPDAVSYTHLDVYKRQDNRRSLLTCV